MARTDRGSWIVELVSKCVRVAGFAVVAPALLLTASTGEGQSLRLHTPSAASPTSASFVVPFDAQGQPLPAMAGTFPSGFSAAWQLPAPGSSAPYGFRFAPRLRFAWVGAAADDAVALSGEAASVLQNRGFLDGEGNYTGGSPRSLVVAVTPTREGRYLLVLDSSVKKAIALLEIGVELSKPTVRSAVVMTDASLPADTYGALGAGITFVSDLSHGTIVFGDAGTTNALLYSPAATGSRFSALDPIPNPTGFHYISATSAGADGAFWVVGVNGNNYEVRYLDTKARSWDAPVATVAKASGDVLIPAFDPYDPSRMLLVLSKVGSTPIFVLSGLVRGVGRGALSPTAQNAGIDFSSAPALTPVVLAPVPGAARGYLVGRMPAEASERLYGIDLTTGVLSSTPIVFGTARHQTLVLEKPDQTPQSLTIKADATGAISGGQTASFTVTRTETAGAFVARYSTQSADGSALAGRDYGVSGDPTTTGTVTMPAGTTTAKISLPIIAVDGCAPQRTFSVKLTNTDATLTLPSEVQQLIASSNNCTFGVLAPTAAVTAGQALTFTATRSGTYLEGAQALPWTAAPGNASTIPADFTPASSTVTLPSRAASATFNVNTTPTTLDCVPEKAVTVTVRPVGGPSSSATGKIAANQTGCTVENDVSGPMLPYLPGDIVTITLSDVAGNQFDLQSATWTVTSRGGTPVTQVQPVPGGKGAVLKLRFDGSTAYGTEKSVLVTYSVPPRAGAGSTPATGSRELDRVAFYTDLVRLDGPSNYAIPARTPKRHSLIWQGNNDRASTWLSPNGEEASRKTLQWVYVTASGATEVACDHRVGEDCVFALPNRPDVTMVAARVLVGSNTDQTVAEIPVKGVPAPTSTPFESVRYVPIALEFAGVPPAFFETEVTLVNGSAGTVEAELQWGGITQKEIVGAGRQAVLNGLVESLRETNPSQEGAVFPLKVTFRGLASEAEKRLVGVMARTTTPAGAPGIYRRSGRAGLAYRGVPREELLGGATGQSRSAWLIGLRGTSKEFANSVDRSNLGVTKPDPSDPNAVVDVELYGNNGTLLKTLTAQTITGFTQWSNLSDVADGTEVGYARVVWKSGGPVTTYATPINNLSGDGSWVFPVKQEEGTSEKTDALLAPVLFELPDGGAGNFRFVADAALASTIGSTNTVVDYFWTGGGQEGTTSLTRSVQGQAILGASQIPGTKSLGVVEEIRKGTGSTIPVQTQGQLVIGMGLVRRADNQTFVPGTLMAGARVDGPTAGDPDASKYGRFGIYLPGIPLRDLKGLAEMRILGLRQDDWVRSNLALINPGTEPVALKLELHVTKADGTAASALPTAACGSSQVQDGLVTLPARTFCQIGSVLNTVDATSGYAVLSRTGADAASSTKTFYAYGVVNDGPDSTRGTSDGAYLLPELVRLAATGCSFTFDPPLAEFCQAGGSRSVKVTPSSSSCTGVFATDSPSWITPPTTPVNGQPVTVTFTVAAMTGASLNAVREGTLSIQGQVGYQAIRQSSPQPLMASNNGPVAVGNTLNLAAAGAILGATYAWTGPNGFTSSLQNPTIVSATVAAAGTYSVTQTINGCVSAAATTTVTVEPSGSTWTAQEVTVLLPGGVPLVMRRIPGETFPMGAPESERGTYSSEQPVHQVTLTQDHYVGKYEVTQAQWQAVMGANPSEFQTCGSGCPVEQVSWDDIRGATGFIAKLNQLQGTTKFRLPTEAEWEHAARGGTQTRFSFGNALTGSDECLANSEASPYVWWCRNAGGATHSVGVLGANGYGLHDLHGNVWEWVEDWYEVYSSAAQIDPSGPSTGSGRVLRGGSWYDGLRNTRSAQRNLLDPGNRGGNVGFRLARSQ